MTLMTPAANSTHGACGGTPQRRPPVYTVHPCQSRRGCGWCCRGRPGGNRTSRRSRRRHPGTPATPRTGGQSQAGQSEGWPAATARWRPAPAKCKGRAVSNIADPEHAIKWCRRAQRDSTSGCRTLCVLWLCSMHTVAPHLAGALAANAAREGAEVKGAVNAANGHRRLERLPWWLTFVEIDIREYPSGQGGLRPGVLSHKFSAGMAAVRRGAEPQASDNAV